MGIRDWAAAAGIPHFVNRSY